MAASHRLKKKKRPDYTFSVWVRERLLGVWLGIYKKSVTDILDWGRKCLCAQIHSFKKSRTLSAHYLLRAGLDYWLLMMCDTGPLSSCMPASDRWQRINIWYEISTHASGCTEEGSTGGNGTFLDWVFRDSSVEMPLRSRLSEGHGRPFKWLLTGNFILITVSTSSGHQDTSSLLLISYFALWKVSLSVVSGPSDSLVDELLNLLAIFQATNFGSGRS